jgi:hypothetical protein
MGVIPSFIQPSLTFSAPMLSSDLACDASLLHVLREIRGLLGRGGLPGQRQPPDPVVLDLFVKTFARLK